MDRFIVSNERQSELTQKTLKSNMDRFIDSAGIASRLRYYALKSNMDRFIVILGSYFLHAI